MLNSGLRPSPGLSGSQSLHQARDSGHASEIFRNMGAALRLVVASWGTPAG